MASTDARPLAYKNTAYRYSFAIRKSDGTLITTWAGADSEVSLDGGAFADCTNEATEIGTSGCGYIDLTAAEMNADCVILKITVTNTGALPIVVVIHPDELGDIRCNAGQISGDTTAADNLEAAADGTGYNLGGGSVVAASVAGAVGSVTGAVGSVTGAVGSVTGSVGSVTGAVGSVTAGVTLAADQQVDVVKWKGATAPAMTGDAFARIGAPAGASLVADLGTATAATQGYVLAVKAKTDALPADPAGETSIGVVDGIVDAIKAKTDLIPASPAAVSDIPTANITAIKAKTDNLPAAPAAVGDVPTAAANAAAVLASTVDTLTVSKLLQALMAVLANKAAPIGNEVSFKDRAGTTEVARLTYGATPGERTASVVT